MHDPFDTVKYRHGVPASDADERDIEEPGPLDAKCGRRRDRDEGSCAEGGNLLHQLERAAARNKDETAVRLYAGPAHRTDELVQCIVTADILADAQDRSVEISPGGRMHGTG